MMKDEFIAGIKIYLNRNRFKVKKEARKNKRRRTFWMRRLFTDYLLLSTVY